MFNTAWDYASDTRGYTIGASIALVHPTWRLIFGSYQVPTTRNGNVLDGEIYRARGDNLELTVKPGTWGTVVRLLAFRNEGRMGDFQQAIDIGRCQGTVPDTLAIESPGHMKYGFGLNLEQPIADEGETGLFVRLGWADGSNSAWSYTEVDSIISAGIQISGRRLGRTQDHLGMAYALQGLSGVHKDYLAAGGLGMLLGDGKLKYGPEKIFEVYYLIQLGRYVQLSPDFQYIENPGFNQDRGPVAVYSLRLRVNY
jgi:carbohydrate-selective porin OprB